MDKRKKSTAAKPTSPKPSPGAKSPVRGRSKSRGRPSKKEVKEVKKPAPRSKSRTKRDKSKGREKSRSPKPRSRSQSGRSASRTRAATAAAAAKGKKEPSVKDYLLDDKKLNLVLKDIKHEDYSKDSALNEIIRRSISRDISQEKIGTLRRSSRISTATSRDNETSKKLDGLSKDIITKAKTAAKAKIPTLRSKVFSYIGNLIALAAPLAITLLYHLSCTRDQCTLTKFHIPRNWRVYLNLEAAEIVLGFAVLQALLLLIPIGKIAQGPVGRNGSLTYRCNGLLSSILTIALIGGLWHYKFPVTIVYEKLIPLIVASAGFGYLLGIILFIKGGKAAVPGLNPQAVTGSLLHQLVVGREINPILFGKLNVKVWIMRILCNGIIVLQGLLALKAFEVRNEWSYTLLTAVGLFVLYVWDFYWFEESFTTMFEAQDEGLGAFACAGYCLHPFVPALITKYIIQHRVELPIYGLVAIAVSFAIGFFIYRASNLQKSAFRKNPLNPALAHFNTIPTSRGKKLLASGWWGWVRHPNYLGDIIIHWAWASTAGYTHAIPFVFPLLTTLLLIHRAKRVDDHCSQKYQSAWQEYSSRVRYRLLPRIY